MSNTLEVIKGKLAEMEAKRKEMVEEIRKDFPAIMAPVFEKYGDIETIRWTQYTPFFNDGEECIFSVRNDDSSIDINGKDYYNEDNYKKNKDMFAFVSSALESIPEDFYKDLFGDHCEVTVKRDGTIEVEEYDHE